MTRNSRFSKAYRRRVFLRRVMSAMPDIIGEGLVGIVLMIVLFIL